MQEPAIRPIEWKSASSVLGHEERGFSAWLAGNLELLAEALELPGLTLVQREAGVGSFRVDILATAEDDSDDGMPVAIENQYGSTNHDHLGKLVTYLAGQQRGLGVWIAERVSDPHLAAVEFLNRTSDDSVGYALVTVRFAEAPEGGHYVDFQVAAQPNEWVTTASESNARRAAPERVELLAAVHALVEQPLLDAGWGRVTLFGPGRARIQLQLPDGHPLRGAGYFTMRAGPTDLRFRHIVQADTLEQSRAFVTALQERYAERLVQLVPEGTALAWNVDTRANQRNDQWYAQHPDGGYTTLDAEAAAQWAIAVCSAWVRLTEDLPVTLVEQLRGGSDPVATDG